MTEPWRQLNPGYYKEGSATDMRLRVLWVGGRGQGAATFALRSSQESAG